MNRMFIPWILWGAFFATSFMHLVIVETQPAYEDQSEPLVLPLALVALGLAFGSFLLPRYLQRTAAARAKVAVEEIPDPDGSIILRERAPTIRVFADSNAARTRAVSLDRVPLIVRLVMSEAIAVYGLVLGTVGAPREIVLPFFVVAWLLFLAHFPTEARAMAPLQRATGARLRDAG